jgi:type II secretory pathway component PulF
LLAGETPAEVLNASGQFPAMFAGQYQTGEISGQLEETLGRLRDYYQEEGSRKLHLVASWTPRGVYLIVALLIAWRVVAFYSGYFKDIQNAGGF